MKKLEKERESKRWAYILCFVLGVMFLWLLLPSNEVLPCAPCNCFCGEDLKSCQKELIEYHNEIDECNYDLQSMYRVKDELKFCYDEVDFYERLLRLKTTTTTINQNIESLNHDSESWCVVNFSIDTYRTNQTFHGLTNLTINDLTSTTTTEPIPSTIICEEQVTCRIEEVGE